MEEKANKMTDDKYILMMLEEIRGEQKRSNELMAAHSLDDSHKAIEIQKELETIKISIARLEMKVENHSGTFGKVWAIILPIIVTGITLAFYGV